MTEDVQRVVMDAGHQSLIKKHGLREWVEQTEDWPAETWNGVVERLRDLFVDADLGQLADDAGSVIAMLADLVVRRQTFINYFLDNTERKYIPDGGEEEWRAIAEVVARILVQRYYREMQAT